MPRYLILLAADDDAWDRLDEQAQKAMTRRYDSWVAELRAAGRYEAGGATVSFKRLEPGNPVRTLTDNDRRVTGFFLISATDQDMAVKLAQGCPALDHQETVDVVELG
jgi:hypothetical protein